MNERQQKIIQILSLRRYEKIDNLAFELNVARRTIERDLYKLSFDYPIYTIQGRNGGVEVMKEAKLKLYEEMFVKMQAAALINAGLDEIESGAKPVSGEEFFNNMKAKYGK